MSPDEGSFGAVIVGAVWNVVNVVWKLMRPPASFSSSSLDSCSLDSYSFCSVSSFLVGSDMWFSSLLGCVGRPKPRPSDSPDLK